MNKKANSKANYFVSVASVRNEIKKIMDENERFARGRTDENEVYAGEVLRTQFERLLKKYDEYPATPTFVKDKEAPTPPGVAVVPIRGIKMIDTVHYYCPRCDKRLYRVRNGHSFNPKYCEICGQAIDWRKVLDL